MSRTVLPNRRQSVTEKITYRSASGGEHEYLVSFGLHDGCVMECFASGDKPGSDMQALLNDACIAISVLLQYGTSADAIASMFGENRAEGEISGPPASPLGAIARAAAAIDAGLTG